jgi:hypothetical protein
MPTPNTRTPVRVARGTYSNLVSSIGDLLEGEICYATDQNKFYAIEAGALTEQPYLSTSGGTVTGELQIGNSGSLVFEGSSNDGFETVFGVADPTADRTITLPDATGTVALTNVAQVFTESQTFADSQTYPKIPANPRTSAYTLVASDAGKHISITTGGATIPANTFSVGDAISIYNNSANAQTITQGSSTTLRKAGSSDTGNRTLAQYGLSTILCVGTNEFVISGSGLT